MKIYTTKEELSAQDICDILFRHEQSFLPRVLKLKDYYLGNHAIMQKEQRANNAPNNKIVSNYCEYISKMSTGFFMGQPVAYTSLNEDEKELQILQEVFKYNDEAAHNMRLAGEMSVAGESYEVLYTDSDAQIRFSFLPAEQIILVCDATLEENIIAAIRRYRVFDLSGSTYQDYVDVYDKHEIASYTYNSGQLIWIKSEPHYFDDVPVVEYVNNEWHRGDFEGVISMVDAYNKAESLTLDDMEDFTDAYLVLHGMGGTDVDDVKELRKNKVLSLEEGGGAEWLIKNINDAYIENIKSRLQKDIHKFSSVPDMSDEAFSGNASGVAIKYKLIGLEQIRSSKERGFKKGLQRRIELIAGMLRTKGSASIDFRDIDITFTANIPANIEELANVVKTLYNVVSQKKLLSLLPFITDPVAELDELRKEQEESLPDLDAQEDSLDGEDNRGILGSPAGGAGSSLEQEKQKGD